MTNHDMTRRLRTRGPLTERQHTILNRLANGERQMEIAADMHLNASYVSHEMCLVTSKMGVRTTQQAIARYSRHLTLLGEAETMRKAKVKNPVEPAEHHVNDVLDDMADEYVRRAHGLLPQ